MSSENPFRNPANLASVELRCPVCERDFYIEPPEALVSLTACPHPNCQHVALVCTGEAAGRDRLGWQIEAGSVAMTLEHFLDARKRESSPTVGDFLFTFGPFFTIFVITPMTMCAYAWREGLELLLLVAMSTSPALVLGLGMIAVLILCERDSTLERGQLAAVRRRAFTRARWQLAQVRPQHVTPCSAP